MKEILLSKHQSLKRCLSQVNSYYHLGTADELEFDFLRQDAIGMNLLRACELAIDMANVIVKNRGLALQSESRWVFEELAEAGLVPCALAESMMRMVGFRHVLVHQYQKLNYAILLDVIGNRVQELAEFADTCLALG